MIPPGIRISGRSYLIAATLSLSLFLPIATAAYLDSDGPRPNGTIGGTIIEGFENSTFPQQPTSAYYTRSSSNGLANLDPSQEDTGTQSYLVDGTVVNSQGTAEFLTTTSSLCAAGGMRFSIRANEDIGNWEIQLINGASNRVISMKAGMASNVVTFTVAGAATTSTTTNGIGVLTAASTAWQHLGFTCDDLSSAAFINYDTGQSQALGGGDLVGINKIRILSTGEGGTTGPIIHIDNLQWGFDLPTAGAFCADHNILNYNGVAEADYGYDYRRGGDFFDQENGDVPGIGLSTGFDYSGTDGTEGQFDYSAKHFTTGTKALHQNITIESATGSPPIQSAFRVNYHTALTTVADVTAKGNGLNTGHFADHLEVEMKSLQSDAWYITFWYVTAGGARTQLSGSHTFGDSFDATQFTIWLDTRSSANAITTLNSHHGEDWYINGGGSLHADPFILLTTDSAADGPNGEEIAVIGIRYLDDIAGNPFVDDTVGDIWNVAMGEIGVASPWHIALDEDNQEGRANTDDEGGLDSTCIFDDAGTAVFANSQGATPGSLNPPPAPAPTGSTGPGGGLVGSEGPAHDSGNPLGNFIAYQNAAWGFDVSAIFAGIVLLSLLIAVMIATKGNLFAGMVTVLVVGGIEVSLGLFGVAMIFLLALLCAGFAAGGIFQSRKQGGDTA